jgi:hypothetical protein
MRRGNGIGVLWTSIGVAALVAGAVGLAVTLQRARFDRRVAREAHELWAAEGGGPGPRRSAEGLPRPVRRYLEVSGAAAREPVRSVRLRHGGTFRPGLDQPWFPILGEQYFSADPPGFVWRGRIRLAPGVWIEARDRSLAGEGHMLIVASGIWTLGDVRGPELDQGALLRLLAEMVWFPTAFLDARHVSWAAIDDASARATLRVGGREATATFHFGADGLPSRLSADRYRDVDGRGVLTPWSGEYADYREVGGLRVPFRSEVSWRVDGEARPYARWVLERIELDRPEPY